MAVCILAVSPLFNGLLPAWTLKVTVLVCTRNVDRLSSRFSPQCLMLDMPSAGLLFKRNVQPHTELTPGIEKRVCGSRLAWAP